MTGVSSGGFELLARLGLEDGDETCVADDRFVIAALIVGQFALIALFAKLMDSILQIGARAEPGDALGDLWREAVAQRRNQIIEDGFRTHI